MKLLLYTHSDYNWVWKYWHQQTDRYLKNLPKICLLNTNSKFRDDYLVIKYDDRNTYKNRILSCINSLNDEETVLFAHEDMFLYDKPKFEILDQFCKLIKNDNCDVIKLIRAFDNLDKSNIRKFQSQLLQSELTLEDTSEDLKIQASNFYKNYLISKSNITSNNKQLKSIQTSLNSIKEEYNIGTKTITDLIDAESALLDINVSYHTSKKNMILNYFNIMALEGTLIKVFEGYLPVYN